MRCGRPLQQLVGQEPERSPFAQAGLGDQPAELSGNARTWNAVTDRRERTRSSSAAHGVVRSRAWQTRIGNHARPAVQDQLGTRARQRRQGEAGQEGRPSDHQLDRGALVQPVKPDANGPNASTRMGTDSQGGHQSSGRPVTGVRQSRKAQKARPSAWYWTTCERHAVISRQSRSLAPSRRRVELSSAVPKCSLPNVPPLSSGRIRKRGGHR